MLMPSPASRGLLVFWLLAASCGAGSPEAASRAYMAKGGQYFAAKKYDEAAIEYRNAIQRTPLLAEAHLRLGEVLAAKSDVVAALGAYVRAADLNPDLIDAQLKASDLLLLARKYDDARVRLRAVLTREPGNTAALVMLGSAMAGLGSLDEAVAASQRAIALDPKRAGSYMNLGAFQYRQGDKKEAEKTFKSAIEVAPNSLVARTGLADFYYLENRLPEAERAYKSALELDPLNLMANRAIASFYLKTGRFQDAEAYLRKVAETAKTAEDWYALADYYVATGRRARALQILQGMRRNSENYVDATVRIAFLAMLDHQPVPAMKLVDEVLGKLPTSAPALALKTHLLLAAKKRTEALTTALAAVKGDGKSEQAHFAHAVAARALGQLEEAKNAFLEVLRINPLSAEALIELAQLHLDQNLVETALQFADQAVRANPDLIEAQLMRLRVMANSSERREEAAGELAKLVAKYPKSAEVQYEAGIAAVARKDNAGAYRYFLRARALSPTYTRALVELIKLDLQAGRQGDARRRADEELVKSPDSIEVLLIAGNTYAMIDGAIAERHLRKVLQLDPSNITAYQSLATLYLSQGKLDQARDEFVNLTKQQPTNVAPPTMVGIIYEAQQNPAEAEKWYQQALKVDGRAAAAANNLAWMYAEQGRNLEAAVELASIARGELPRQAEVTDTLGWAYLKKGLTSQAVRTLQDAVTMDPNNPLFHYHLGLAYAQTGEDARARMSLKQALALNPKFAQAVEAQRALAKLLY